MIGKDVPFAAAAGHRRAAARRTLRRGLGPPAGGRVPVRDEPVPRAGVHLQARADPRGRLRQPAAGAAARAARPDRGGHRSGSYADRLAEQVERLAHHASRGEVWDKAVTYLRQAGAKALGALGAPRGGGVLRAGARGAPASPRESRDPRAGHRSPARPAQPAPVARRVSADPHPLREADTLATTLDDSHRLGRIAAWMSQYFDYAGDYEHAVAAGQRALP